MQRLLMSFIHFKWSLKNRHLKTALVWIQFLSFASRGFRTLAIGLNWIPRAGRSLNLLPSCYRCWKRSWEFIQINLNKTGTKIQVTWFPRWRQYSASHLLGPSCAPRAFPVSPLLPPASAKQSQLFRTGTRALTSDRTHFKSHSLKKDTHLLGVLGQTAWTFSASTSSL